MAFVLTNNKAAAPKVKPKEQKPVEQITHEPDKHAHLRHADIFEPKIEKHVSLDVKLSQHDYLYNKLNGIEEGLMLDFETFGGALRVYNPLPNPKDEDKPFIRFCVARSQYDEGNMVLLSLNQAKRLVREFESIINTGDAAVATSKAEAVAISESGAVQNDATTAKKKAPAKKKRASTKKKVAVSSV